VTLSFVYQVVYHVVVESNRGWQALVPVAAPARKWTAVEDWDSIKANFVTILMVLPATLLFLFEWYTNIL